VLVDGIADLRRAIRCFESNIEWHPPDDPWLRWESALFVLRWQAESFRPANP